MKTRMEKQSKSAETDMNHRMQISMSKQTEKMLDWLKEHLEATSYAEVIRRSLIFYEKIVSLSIDLKIQEDTPIQSERSVRIQVLLTKQSKDRLDRLKETIGKDASYSSVIRSALSAIQTLVDAETQGRELVMEKDGRDFRPNYPIAA